MRFEGASNSKTVPMGQQKLTMVEIPVNNMGILKVYITSVLAQWPIVGSTGRLCDLMPKMAAKRLLR